MKNGHGNGKVNGEKRGFSPIIIFKILYIHYH